MCIFENPNHESAGRMNVAKIEARLSMPVLAGFFIMGCCDRVAPVTSRIAAEFPSESRRAVD